MEINKREMENMKITVNQKFEIEKNKIIKDYVKLLYDVENECKINQNDDLEDFINDQQLKFEHEKDVLIRFNRNNHTYRL